MLTGIALPAAALVDIVNSPNSGMGVYQRNAENGTYTVKVFLDVKQAANISALEANVTYNNTVFTNVSLSDQINGSSGAIWETSVANANYETVGSTTTVKYLKASTNGDYWSVAAGSTPILYTLTFRIRNDAVTGAIYIRLDANYAKVQDNVTGNITGALRNDQYNIVLDTTAPVTSVTNGIVGGWYASAQAVNLATNELNNEATINYSTDSSDPTVSANHVAAQVMGIGIPATANGIRSTTLNYYAQDWAKNAPPNVESPYQTQVYYIDTEYPTINSLEYTAGPIGIGGTVYVTFNINDASGQLYNSSYPLVNITGHPATKVSGSGMGVYVFSKVLAGNDDNGSHYADISVQVRDKAGNTSTLTRTNAIALDFQGPTFAISVTPDPAMFPNIATLNVTASETLLTIPTVFISPRTYANYVARNGLAYTYTFEVTGNGWTANVPWLGMEGDNVSPQINALEPVAGAMLVPTISNVALEITDQGRGVATGTIMVTINGELAVSGGISADPASYSVVLSAIPAGFRVSIDPVALFNIESVVTIEVTARDATGNVAVLTYSFKTEDLTPPAIDPVQPTADAVDVSMNTPLIFNVIDFSAVVTSSVFVSINDTLAISAGGTADPLKYSVMISQITGGLRIELQPLSHFTCGRPVSVSITAADNAANAGSLVYSFTVEPDSVPPLIVPVDPTANQLFVSRNLPVTILLEDAGSGISTGSIFVTINGRPAIAAGIVSAGCCEASLVPSGDYAYQIVVTPDFYIGYWSPVTVEVSVQDAAYPTRNAAVYTYMYRTDTDPGIIPQISLKVYLQGYYNPLTDRQKPVTINLQFRPLKFGPALRTFSLPLNAQGETGAVSLHSLPADFYYVVICHELTGADIGVNHLPVLIDQAQPFLATFPIILDLRTRPNAYYYAPYISGEATAPAGGTLDPFFTESNGRRSIRAGNAVLDADGAINILDFARWRSEWENFAGQGSVADFNADGSVDTMDFAIWRYNNENMYPVDY
jgi:hypothetical protein